MIMEKDVELLEYTVKHLWYFSLDALQKVKDFGNSRKFTQSELIGLDNPNP
jgi:hypothetical protein